MREMPSSAIIQSQVEKIHVGVEFARCELEQMQPRLLNYSSGAINRVLQQMKCISSRPSEADSPKAAIIFARDDVPGAICEECPYNVSNTVSRNRKTRCVMLSDEE